MCEENTYKDRGINNQSKKDNERISLFIQTSIERDLLSTDSNIDYFLRDSEDPPKLTEELRSLCEGKLKYKECFDILQTFEKNKTPGNDGLSVEFYLGFWPLIGNLLVASLNAAYEFGELSNSQKQAVIKLIEKKRER